MKKIITYISLTIVALVLIFVVVARNKKPEVPEGVADTSIPGTISMCYQYFQNPSSSSGFPDRAWLKMNILGDRVTGEYQNLPAEKDKKVGKFTGTVGAMDPETSARIADVWWDSSAEGMNVKEQLNIEFGEGSAVALFGEMIDRGDGVYVYKDAAGLTSGFQMSQIDCEKLNGQILGEQSSVCTMDAMQCPGGSYVGRTGPDCEFVCEK